MGMVVLFAQPAEMRPARQPVARATMLFATDVDAPLIAARWTPRPPAAILPPPSPSAAVPAKRLHPRVNALKVDVCQQPSTPVSSASPCSSASGIQERLRWPAPGSSKFSPARSLKFAASPKASPVSIIDGASERPWPSPRHLELASVHDASILPGTGPLSGLSPGKANRTQPKIDMIVPSPMRIASLKLLEGAFSATEENHSSPPLRSQRCSGNDAFPRP
jgi:hypothetical protein